MLRAGIEAALVIGGWMACVAAAGWGTHRAVERTNTTLDSASLAAGALAGLATSAPRTATETPTLPPLRTATPQALIESAIERIRAVDALPPSPWRDALAMQTLDGVVDYEALTRRSLGAPCPSAKPCRDRWVSLTSAQQGELTELSRELAAKRVRVRLARTLEIVDVRETGQTTRVRTRVPEPGEAPFHVDYVVARDAGGLRVVDVVIEGSSMVKNHFDQYDKMLDDPAQGYPHLVSRLRKKIATTKP